jgi:hypothetical protein
MNPVISEPCGVSYEIRCRDAESRLPRSSVANYQVRKIVEHECRGMEADFTV